MPAARDADRLVAEVQRLALRRTEDTEPDARRVVVGAIVQQPACA